MASLQEALRQAGLSESKPKSKKESPRRERRASPNKKSDRPQSKKPSSEMDLADAYRLRQLAEKQEAEQRKKDKLAAQEARRQRNLAVEKIIKDQACNDRQAELPRYFEYRGKIRRVLCTEDQRDALNAGGLAVVVFKGGALLVAPGIAEEVAKLAPDLVPVITQTDAAPPEESSDDYPPVPDDLMW